jgi:hypothetical protein
VWAWGLPRFQKDDYSGDDGETQDSAREQTESALGRPQRVGRPFTGEGGASCIDETLDVLVRAPFRGVEPLRKGKKVLHILGQGFLPNAEGDNSLLAAERVANFTENVRRGRGVLRQNQHKRMSRIDPLHDGSREIRAWRNIPGCDPTRNPRVLQGTTDAVSDSLVSGCIADEDLLRHVRLR